MDLQPFVTDFQAQSALYDTTHPTPIVNRISALLHDLAFLISQVDNDAYVLLKKVGFLNHEDTPFKFIDLVCIDSVERCIEIANIIRGTGMPNYRTCPNNIKFEH